MCKDSKGCCAKCGCTMSMISKWLVVIGGLNWGLVGVGMLMNSNWNVVNMLLGTMPGLEAVVYVLVGLAAIGLATGCKCKKCKAACGSCEVKGEQAPAAAPDMHTEGGENTMQ